MEIIKDGLLFVLAVVVIAAAVFYIGFFGVVIWGMADIVGYGTECAIAYVVIISLLIALDNYTELKKLLK